MTQGVEPTAYPPGYPLGGTFATLLTWNLDWGTRPFDCSTKSKKTNRRWRRSDFASIVCGNSVSLDSALKNLRNWANRGIVPQVSEQDRVDRIFAEFFGDDPRLAHFRRDMEDALKREREEKGLIPGKRTSANARPSLSPSPSENDKLETAMGAGSRASTPHGLQEPPTYFLGREDDVRKIREVLLYSESSVAILVHGTAGIGKTTLTRAVAHDPVVVKRFGNRRWFAALETAKTSEQLEDAIVLALGGDRTAGLAATLNQMGQFPGLLILDNLETPWEPKDERQKAEQVLSTLMKVPGLSLLASFRGTDRISRPAWISHSLGQLALEPSKELFCRIPRRCRGLR